jgi:hypothetical protein
MKEEKFDLISFILFKIEGKYKLGSLIRQWH